MNNLASPWHRRRENEKFDHRDETRDPAPPPPGPFRPQPSKPNPAPTPASAEYQGMLEELHAPAPSPIYLATGQRPLPDDSLKVKQHDTRTALNLKTQSLQITIDRQSATLTLLNLQTHASWVFSLPDQTAAIANITRQQNNWTIPLGNTTLTLQLMTAGMATNHHRPPHPGVGPIPANHPHRRSRSLLRPRRALRPGRPLQHSLRRPSRRPLRRARPQLELRSHPPRLHPHRPRPLCRHSV